MKIVVFNYVFFILTAPILGVLRQARLIVCRIGDVSENGK